MGRVGYERCGHHYKADHDAIPADFAEQDIRAGHFSPADQWSVWTEEGY